MPQQSGVQTKLVWRRWPFVRFLEGSNAQASQWKVTIRVSQLLSLKHAFHWPLFPCSTCNGCWHKPAEILPVYNLPSKFLSAESTPHYRWPARTDHLKQWTPHHRLPLHRLSEPVAVYAHTKVYMLTPRPESNDAHIVRVLPENLATCTTLWRESEVFNFGDLFRAFRMDRKSIPNQGIILHPALLL